MKVLNRAVGALARTYTTVQASWKSVTAPPPGRLIVPDSQLDAYRQTVSDWLDFARLRSLLSAADSGDLASGLGLFREIEQKEGTIRSVASTRRQALTGLDYEIVSAAEVEDLTERNLADEAADYVRQQLRGINGFKAGLKGLARAIGDNLAVAETVWEGNHIVEIAEVYYWRLTADPQQPGVVKVITRDDRTGIDTTLVPDKWIVHIPEPACGFPLAESLAWATTFIYVASQVAVADWITFCEIFGMPIRIGRYRPTAGRAEKRELAEWMEALGTKAWGIFSQAVNLEIVETTQRGTAPYEAFLNWAERKIAKIWLGGNLVADTTGGTGTHAAASVQDEVREDLRDDDIENEGSMVRSQIIEPLIRFKFWRADVPLPYFRRKKPEMIDRLQEADLFGKAQLAGLKIPKKYAHERLGIPEPEQGEETLTPSLDAFGQGMEEGTAERDQGS
jgi:phage gp29-like protein